MRTESREHGMHDRGRVGKAVIVFLLPFLILGCEDAARERVEEARRAREARIARTTAQASTPAEAEPVQRPDTPLAAVSGEDAGEEPGQVMGPVSYDTAEEAYRDGRFGKAVRHFEAYVGDHPDNPWGHYMLGLSAWKAGELEEAEEALRETTALDPEHPKGWLNLARVLLEEGRPDEARGSAERALELYPEWADGLRVLARVAHDEGDLDAAVDGYRRAIMVDGEDAWSMNNLGLIHIRRGDFEAALPPLARAVRIRDDVAVFRNNLGVALERTGHYAAAAEAYGKAVELAGGHEKASLSLARVQPLSESQEAGPVDVDAVAEAFVETVEGWRGEKTAEASPEPPPEDDAGGSEDADTIVPDPVSPPDSVPDVGEVIPPVR